MFTRRTEGKVNRTTEAERAKRFNPYKQDIKDIVGAKLGIHKEGRNIDKLRFEINRNRKYLKEWGITDEQLKELGL